MMRNCSRHRVWPLPCKMFLLPGSSTLEVIVDFHRQVPRGQEVNFQASRNSLAPLHVMKRPPHATICSVL